MWWCSHYIFLVTYEFISTVYALGQVYGVEGDLSSIARQGSGSACRSMYGGLVRWYKGELEDGTDSIARPIAPADHFSNLKVIICVVSRIFLYTA